MKGLFLCCLCRGTETEEQIKKRLRTAKNELEQFKTPGLFDHILVNDDLETCYQNLKVLLCSPIETENTNKQKPVILPSISPDTISFMQKLLALDEVRDAPYQTRKFGSQNVHLHCSVA